MIALAIITAVLNPLFLGGDNLRNNVRHISLISLFALGEAMVIIAGGIDLSIGSIICITAVTTSYLTMYAGLRHRRRGRARAACSRWSSASRQGRSIARLGVPPFVVTLGSMLLLRGVAEVLTGGTDIGFQGKYPGFRFLGEGIALGLPVPFWFALGADRDHRVPDAPHAVRALLLRDRLERRGGAPVGRPGARGSASSRSWRGVPVGRRRHPLRRVSADGDAVARLAYELHAVAAAVLGGCSLQGGQGLGVRRAHRRRHHADHVQRGEPGRAVAVAERRRGRRDPGGGDRRPRFREERVAAARSMSTATHRQRRLPTLGATRAAHPGHRRGRQGRPGLHPRGCSPIHAFDALHGARALPQPQAAGADRGWRCVTGSIENRAVVAEAMAGRHPRPAPGDQQGDARVDHGRRRQGHVLAARGRAATSPTFQQFILIGGDAGMGHFFYPHPIPVTETQKHSAYPGCYALSKVLEEVMLEQYYIQYDLNGCCLRAPWIMEKDDFKYQLSFGDDVFGGPRWRDLVGREAADGYVEDRRGAGDARSRRAPGEAQLRPRRRSRATAILAAIDQPEARASRRSTSAWTSRSTTASSAPI